MRRPPSADESRSGFSRLRQLARFVGLVGILVALTLGAHPVNPAAAQEAVPADTAETDQIAPAESIFVIARVLACPAADADPAACESLAGVQLDIGLDGTQLPGGIVATVPNPIGSYSADFLAGTGNWLTIAVAGGLPEGYAPAAGSDPFMALVGDLPLGSCGGESTCSYADLTVVPTDPTDPQPAPGGTAITIYSVLCPAGTAVADLYATCYDTSTPGMPFRAGIPNSDAFSPITFTDSAGYVTFTVPGGTARIIQEIPDGASIAASCTADGVPTAVAIVDSGNPALGVADVALVGAAVRCDWFLIPAGSSGPTEPPTPDVDDAHHGTGDEAAGNPDPVAGPDPTAGGTGAVTVNALPNTGAGTGSSDGAAATAMGIALISATVAALIGAAALRRGGIARQ